MGADIHTVVGLQVLGQWPDKLSVWYAVNCFSTGRAEDKEICKGEMDKQLILRGCMCICDVYVNCCYNQENIKDIEKRFGGRDGQKLLQMAPKDFAAATRELNEAMRTKLSKSQGSGLLKDYSPWLHAFQANSYTETLEVPGQNNTIAACLS